MFTLNYSAKSSEATAAATTNKMINTKPASLIKSNSASANVNSYSNEYLQQHQQQHQQQQQQHYQQQQQKLQQQQQFHLQLQHLQHNKDKFLKNYIVSHCQRGPPEPLRIIETVIAEDAETNANTPESQTDSNTSTSQPYHQQLQQHESAATVAASSTSSSLSIYTALPQSYSFSPPSTLATTNTFTSYMTASASVPTSVSAASSNTSCNNKFTRKRERVCNSNSNNAISKMAYCKAFSK